MLHLGQGSAEVLGSEAACEHCDVVGETRVCD
jgi:hypothetical protein